MYNYNKRGIYRANKKHKQLFILKPDPICLDEWYTLAENICENLNKLEAEGYKENDRLFIVYVSVNDIEKASDCADGENFSAEELADHIEGELKTSVGAHMPDDPRFYLLRNVKVTPLEI